MGISDTELLEIVDDLADENGWVSTNDVRLQLGENPERPGKSGVGSRLSWMRRFGWLERGASKTWRITAMGRVMIDNPVLARNIQSALDKMNPAQRLAMTRELSKDGATRPDEIRNALRREWQRNLFRR
jgi:hypothetical protein